MNKLLAGLLALASVHVFVPTVGAEAHAGVPLEAKGEHGKKKALSDAQIKALLIEESIASREERTLSSSRHGGARGSPRPSCSRLGRLYFCI